MKVMCENIYLQASKIDQSSINKSETKEIGETRDKSNKDKKVNNW